MNPLVSEAKQDFRAEAVPMVVEMNFMLRWSRKEGGRRDSWGPERGMEGRVQVVEEDLLFVGFGGEDERSPVLLSNCLCLSSLSFCLSLSFLMDGGPPMMPPSRNLKVMGGGGGESFKLVDSAAPIDSVLVTRPTMEVELEFLLGALLEAPCKTVAILATVRGEMALRSI